MKALCGGIAQLARAPALQAGGHRFESDYLHHLKRQLFMTDEVTKTSAKDCSSAG